jgi:2-dehydropantoate 2-reductase
MEKPRVLIIGAGVNGSAVASGLFNGGVDVTVLARGRRLKELQAEGIVIENPFNHRRTVTRVPVIDHLAPDDIYDFVLVVVRKNQALDLLPLLAQNHSPNIVFMGNNLVGPEQFISVLGRERVMMGAVYAAGKREGSLIRAMIIKSAGSPFGEIDGSITHRLKRLATILNQGGFKVKLANNIVDTQMTHGVGVAIIAMLVLKHGGKIRQLARSTEDLKLFVAARREGQDLIRHLGHQVIPRSEQLLVKFPSIVQVLAMRLLLNSKFGEVGLEYHVSQAPDEMQQMAMELRQLVDQAGIPLPAIRKVLAGET